MKTAIVIEDDPQIASFITTGLQQAGFAVDHAADGDEGLSLAVIEPFAFAELLACGQALIRQAHLP